jgi:iron-sulfur cluster assembly accessory protein
MQLSEAAAVKVKQLLDEEGRTDVALRVAVQPAGCCGLSYVMYLDDRLTKGDVAEEQLGVKVVIDHDSFPYLTQATIDFVDSPEAPHFTIDNPAEEGSCTCGRSGC